VEPSTNDPRKEPEPRKEEKERPRRFQIVKLEERIAPARGGRNHTYQQGHCHNYTAGGPGCG
jgi:hypothetical protein